jgi:hypothetical protein
MAISVAALIVMATYAVDAGSWRYQAMLVQTAADSGAIAAAANLANLSSPSPTTMYAAANIATAANGMAGSASCTAGTNTCVGATAANGVTVTVNNPPVVPSPNPFTSSSVQVVVSRALPASFGWKSQTVSASAVASNGTPGNCLVALESATWTTATVANGNSTISAPTCGMAANGELALNSPDTINAKTITYMHSMTGSATYTGAGTPQVTSTVTADPCQGIAGCNYLALNAPSSTCSSGNLYNVAPTSTPATQALSPGTYCWATFTGGVTYNFAPGVYNFVDGIVVNTSGAVLNGTGVTLYTPANQGIVIDSGSTINLTAPTTGNTAGVVVYTAIANNLNTGLQFNSNADNVALNGLVYIGGSGSNGGVQLNGGGGTVTMGSLVCQWYTLNHGSGTTVLNLTGAGSGASSGTGGLSQ